MSDSVQTDTTEDSFVPPGATAYPPEDYLIKSVGDDAILQVTALADFLVENFPDEINPSNRQVPETPVDTAVRLLLALSATQKAFPGKRCQAAYCNRPESHDGPCGWVESSG